MIQQKIKTLHVTQVEFKYAYRPIWLEGKVVWENEMTNEIFIATKVDNHIELSSPPPFLKYFLKFDPKSGEVDIRWNGFSQETIQRIEYFLRILFTTYKSKFIKEYQIHIRFDKKWKVKKLSIINSRRYVEDIEFTIVLATFFKTLVSGDNIQKAMSIIGLKIDL